MAQSKKDSKKEIRYNIGTGFFLSWVLTSVLQHFKLMDLNPFLITCIFTVVSYYRSYFFRRYYNTLTMKKMAETPMKPLKAV